jgi:hypothetical protein
MIINQDKDLVVPDNTIAIFPLIPNDGVEEFDMDFNSFLKPLNLDHKRDWFSSHFYHCLPLSIGNMQGFVFSVPFGFDVLWNGGDSTNDIKIDLHSDASLYKNKNQVNLKSEFGSGILTIHFPVTLKTPPGINLMTIAPPNYPIPGMSPMTGVVESDNLRFTFTMNLKMDLPNIIIRVFANTPLMGLIPIPRNFCDSFELKNAYDIFDKDIVEEERNVVKKHTERREMSNYNKSLPDRLYYRGMDVNNNKFINHQLPKKTTN